MKISCHKANVSMSILWTCCLKLLRAKYKRLRDFHKKLHESFLPKVNCKNAHIVELFWVATKEASFEALVFVAAEV